MSQHRRRHLLMPLSAALALALAACGGGQDPQQAPRPAVTVATLAAQQVTLTRELPGRTHAWLVAEVRPQVNGLVARRLFTEGALVEAGQPLYQLDDATYRAAANSARAQLARAEATRTAAQLTARRTAELVKIDAVSRQDNDNAQAALKQAEADVGAARAALDAANVPLGHARITAPISGRIGKSSVTQGALVTANQAAPLATVQQLDPIHVDLTQTSAELLQLRKALAAGTLESTASLPVTILLEDGTAYAHPGTLKFSEVSVDPGTGSFSVRVEVANPDQVLLPGMYVRAVVGAGVRNDAILVPQRGIGRDAKGNTTAIVVGDDGTVSVRPVRVSQTIGDAWLVEDGLAAGDRVVTAGLQKIKPGDVVEVTEDVADAKQVQPAAAALAAASAVDTADADAADAATPASSGATAPAAGASASKE
ncbi:efflux RND transporter periplasmic adaptor subunit [Luteimonas sp. MC1572]|uniref:efflux RND transporter periplasmic adaptor subunit n=1 Tax=Luteimonas sp. MC1572 TaxID=2799325 RepID=UPI0018F07FA0|nr:efflux RND transporter periplasmic adaptor subunit [Luteimonas sp. MC1572]MBJ6981651.1 efflux RND transporter periplasmic adaptor subunit [Luteimonas sp. MC1572]QQO02944.1 efflux RND transporter periplasmic adaptor subunit [Luteimonas sp. MC1572]